MDRSHQGRLIIVFSAFLAGLAIVAARLVLLHTSGAEAETTTGGNYKQRITELPHLRGRITDRNDELLVSDISVTTLVVDRGIMRTGKDRPMLTAALAWHSLSKTATFMNLSPREQQRRLKSYARSLQEMPHAELIEQHLVLVCRLLSRPLGMTQESIRERILKGKARGEVVLDRDIPRDVAYKLEELVDRNHLAGLMFRTESKRSFSMPELAAHTIGYESEKTEVKDGKVRFVDRAVAGMELACDKWLTGIDGRRIENLDAQGLPLRGMPGTVERPLDGNHVQLTIDYRLQQIVEEEMSRAAEEAKMEQGAIVMLEPKTGEILAVASYPSFDLETRENINNSYFHYALQATYEPGSTFKIVTAAAGLETRAITPQTKIFCHHGRYSEPGVRMIKDSSSLGDVTLGKVLAKSSNIGVFKIASAVGPARLEMFIEKFGFLQPTGIGLGGDPPGASQNVQNRQNMSRISYGYSIEVTPLQIACAYGAIANGGKLMQPTLLRRVIAHDGKVLHENEPVAVRRVMSQRTASTMRELLGGVVQKGATGRRAQVEGFSVAGKTGTSTLIKKGKYINELNVASFAGMMPVDDPAFVCVVVLSNPQTTDKKRFGGVLAAPVFARIAERAAKSLNLEPDRPVETKHVPPFARN